MIRLNDVYGKLVDGKLVEAPMDFEGVMNYNSDSERLIADGWKKVIWETEPTDGKVYKSVYAETETNILQSFVEVVQEMTITKLEFLNRFTDMELAMIYTAAKTNIAIEIWLVKFNAVKDNIIYLESELTIAGVQHLETVGLIGAGRGQQILN